MQPFALILFFVLGVIAGIGIQRRSEDFRLYRRISRVTEWKLEGITASELIVLLLSSPLETLELQQHIHRRRMPKPPPPPPAWRKALDEKLRSDQG